MKKYILLISIVLTVSGCVTAPTYITPENYVKKTPVDGQVRSAGVGDTIIEEGHFLIYDGLDLKEDVEAGGGWQVKYFMPSQLLVAESEDEKFTYYFGNDITTHDSLVGTRYVVGGIKILKEPKDGVDTVQIFGVSPQTTFLKKKEPIIERTSVTKRSDEGYSKELLFGGMRNGLIVIKYIENSNDQRRRDVVFDMEFDPSDIVFTLKGVKIKVVDASSTSLKYQILSGFRQENLTSNSSGTTQAPPIN